MKIQYLRFTQKLVIPVASVSDFLHQVYVTIRDCIVKDKKILLIGAQYLLLWLRTYYVLGAQYLLIIIEILLNKDFVTENPIY